MKLFNALNPLSSYSSCCIFRKLGLIDLSDIDLSSCMLIVTLLITLICIRKYFNIRRINTALSSSNQEMMIQHGHLQQELAELEEGYEENIRVLQIIAHDLRSPMAAIVGLSGFMLDEHQLAEEDLEVIRLIHTSGTDSIKFINEILDRDTPIAALKKEEVNLYQLLSYCVAQLRYKAAEKEQEIVLNGDQIYCSINREKMWRVLTNLLTNAVKFSPARQKIEVNLAIVDDKIQISVADNGIGIPDELKEKIFTRNTQRKRAGTEGEKSFGLGLAVAKQNVEMHNGTLYFTSIVGMGTTFFIDLPLAK